MTSWHAIVFLLKFTLQKYKNKHEKCDNDLLPKKPKRQNKMGKKSDSLRKFWTLLNFIDRIHLEWQRRMKWVQLNQMQ